MEEEDSDEQPEPVVTTRTSPRIASKVVSKVSDNNAGLRQRFAGRLRSCLVSVLFASTFFHCKVSTDAGEKERDRFTPTPRRSIHSFKVTETSRQTLTRSADGRQLSHDYSYEKETFKVQ